MRVIACIRVELDTQGLKDASYCEVCKVQLTSLKQLKEHLNGTLTQQFRSRHMVDAGARHQEALLKVQRQDREQFRGRKANGVEETLPEPSGLLLIVSNSHTICRARCQASRAGRRASKTSAAAVR